MPHKDPEERKKYYREYHKKYYKKKKAENPNYYRDKNRKLRDSARKFVVAYLQESSCIDCSFSDYRALDFDHRNDKFKDVSEMVVQGYCIERIKEEIEKCDIRCANCHRIKTFQELSYHKRLDE